MLQGTHEDGDQLQLRTLQVDRLVHKTMLKQLDDIALRTTRSTSPFTALWDSDHVFSPADDLVVGGRGKIRILKSAA